MGAQISKVQWEKTLGYIEKGKADGGKVVVGGGRHGNKGYFVQPTLLEVKPDNVMAREEIFGPVGAIIKFKDEAEAVQIANDTTVRVHPLDAMRLTYVCSTGEPSAGLFGEAD